MVNLAAMVWRRLLRKRWVLALVFGLSLVYFLSSTFKQEERAVRDRNLLQIQDHDQPIPWKVQFNLGNSSRPSTQCRNSIQGKHLITDELGYVCERKDLLVNGCCNVNVPGTKQYCCDGCWPNGCCSAYEYCVSCCLQPNKQLLLERFLNRAAVAFQNLFMAVEDHFELCLAKCRTSSQMCPAFNILVALKQNNLLTKFLPFSKVIHTRSFQLPVVMSSGRRTNTFCFMCSFQDAGSSLPFSPKRVLFSGSLR
ncbi:PREDICTED: UPF0454 protein C12orf49 homolog isoform X2 [Propithecus coquereli]|uniref:UPF0454 protein C12orf49 homolog isoform X2 n=1 Tax=Propithecus coquereli TaxID=379532 RepID=UPI00063EF428|nr:PREDICTED: UPF0454 protein C12orf49 homolog isoform X2 [Propithecus coquereli]